MNNDDHSALDAEIINITPKKLADGNRGKIFSAAIFTAVIIMLLSFLGLYTDSLWFDSLGFGSRFWGVVALGWGLFAVFGILTFIILRCGFYALDRYFEPEKLAPRKIVLNNQPVDVNPARVLKPLGWIVALVFSISYAFGLSDDWQTWMLYLHQPLTDAAAGPIFGKSLGFYLFSLPVYHEIFSWLTTLTVILLFATIVYVVLA
ncbi:MAG: UPF0182 family protein, partial [Pyrinomonadaceae bacterium]